MAGFITNDTLKTDDPSVSVSRRRLLLALPAVGFAGLAAVFAWGISRDPNQLPSALIGKEVPRFDLPPVEGRPLGLASKDLYGEVSLVNVFASWCVACRAEHPLFMRLARDKSVPIHGLNYKDRPQDAAQWLNILGDPYTRTGPTDWGVYGRYAIPGLGNTWQLVLKESALISITGLVELLRQSQIAAGSTRRPFEFYLTAIVLYLVITWASSIAFRHLEARTRRGTRSSL